MNVFLHLGPTVSGQHQELFPLHDRERPEGQDPPESRRRAEELHGET